MDYKLDRPLSPELEKYRDRIEATIKPYIEIAIENNDQLNWWQSKFGGLPYLPKGFDYPKDFEGKYLFLLAQINFAEVPPLDDFPEKGILQLYIGDDISFGQNYYSHEEKSRFKALYFPEPDFNLENLITNFDFLPEPKIFPIYICNNLQFTKKYAPLPYYDDRFKLIFGEDLYNLIDDDENIYEEYLQISSPSVHKIGGYFSPHFGLGTDIDKSNPQYEQDPYLLLQDPDILLLQMNTDDVMGISWATNGAAMFFIDESELQQLDFNNVYYYWGREGG